MKIKSNLNVSNSEASVSSDGVTTFKELRVTSEPINENSVANKAYVDKRVLDGKYTIGDILVKSTSDTPAGFLKCNGGQLDKTLYPKLYSTIGDKHNIYSIAGNGVPWRNQYNINRSLNSPLTNWVTGTSLPATNMFFQTLITKNKAYILGRYNNSSYYTNCYVANIDFAGTIGQWMNAPITLPSSLAFSHLATYYGKVFMIGGNNGTHQSAFYRSDIDADGNLTGFTALTPLPFTASDHRCTFIKNHLYLIGGYQNGVPSRNVYINHITTSGIPGTWYNHQTQYGTGALPFAITNHLAFIIDRRVYLIGGLIDGVTPNNKVYYNELDDASHLTSWREHSPFPETVYNANFIMSHNKLYIMGGVMNGSVTNKIYYADIRDDTSLGTWQPGGVLPDNLMGFQTLITGGKIYVLGGSRGSNALNNTYYVNLPGGLNDYFAYYSGLIGYTKDGHFRLPDYSCYERGKLYFFMKY